jgi:hypothetical protein
MTQVQADMVTLITAAGEGCGPEIAANKTCHIDLAAGWATSPYSDHLAAATTACSGDGVLPCFLGTTIAIESVVGLLTEYIQSYLFQYVSPACTAADRIIFTDFVANQSMSNNPNITSATFYWMTDKCRTG